MNIGLFDSTFMHQKSMSLGGENDSIPPGFDWARERHLPITFYTDIRLDEVRNRNEREKTSVALLIEPPAFSPTAYQRAFELIDDFDYVLTYSLDHYTLYGPKARIYRFGGTWIQDKRAHVYDKTKMVSMMTSEKRRTIGHHTRNMFSRRAEHFGVDLYGRGSNPIASKLTALKDYRYQVVVESDNTFGYFTEKLIDCFRTGTVPIYWGSKAPLLIFDALGIIYVETAEDLSYHLQHTVSEDDYESRMSAILTNFAMSRDYECAEDYIYNNIPEIFHV